MTESDNDQKLMEAFRGEDPIAEAKIFHRFFRSMCLLSENLTGQLDVAEDIVAETFVKAYERRASFEGIENLKAFLYVSVRNASLSALKAQKRRGVAEKKLNTDKGYHEPETAVVETELLRAALLEQLFQELEELPGQCRIISKMIFIDGKSTADVAEILQLNVQTVRNQKSRAISILKANLFRHPQFASLYLLLLFFRITNKFF